MAKKIDVNVSSITEDGVKIVDGVFKLFDTHGLPLDTILELCQTYRMLPNWIDFYKSARMSGWTDETIDNRLKTSITDIYGVDFSNSVMGRLNKCKELKIL